VRFVRSITDRGTRGVTLPEMLVVLSIVALAVAVAVPLVVDAVRAARIRVAAEQLTVTLRAARMIAVTARRPIDVVVGSDPDNSYEYTDASGRLRHSVLPQGVRIVSPPATITFATNGSAGAHTSLRLEVTMQRGATEIWDIETNLLGVCTVSRSRRP